jgi:hypothetical protein
MSSAPKDVDDVLELLDKFITNNVKPSKSVLQLVASTLRTLQQRANLLEKELSAKPRPQPTIRETAENRLFAEMWAKFPPVPGSNYHRVYCARCCAPMRADKEKCAEIIAGTLKLCCEKCDPPLLLPKELSLTSRQLAKLGKTSS